MLTELAARIRDAERVQHLLKRMDDDAVRQAAWIARCVGRSASSPLTPADVDALASSLDHRTLVAGELLFAAGKSNPGVWIVRSGMVELTVGQGRRRVIIQHLRAGDVDGDVQLVLGMSPPYSAHAVEPTECLVIDEAAFTQLLAQHPAIARRWLTSVAARLAGVQSRLLAMLGRPLREQLPRLLLDESVHGVVPLAQQALAAMLGVRRPSLNHLLREFETSGLVELGYRNVRLLDPAGLRKIAEL